MDKLQRWRMKELQNSYDRLNEGSLLLCLLFAFALGFLIACIIAFFLITNYVNECQTTVDGLLKNYGQCISAYSTCAGG